MMIKYIRFERLTLEDTSNIKDFFEPLAIKCNGAFQIYEDYDVDDNAYKIVMTYDTNAYVSDDNSQNI